MTTRTIFNTVDDFAAIWELVAEQGNQVTPETLKMLEEFYGEVTQNLETKADSYAYVIDDAIKRSDQLKAEAARIVELAKSYQNKAARMKDILLNAMKFTGNLKISAQFHTLNVQQAGGVQALDVQVPVNGLPEKYVKTKTEQVIDKNTLRADIEKGVKVPGVALLERQMVLRIR
jgi:NurA-like 5'-3' nuclease